MTFTCPQCGGSEYYVPVAIDGNYGCRTDGIDEAAQPSKLLTSLEGQPAGLYLCKATGTSGDIGRWDGKRLKTLLGWDMTGYASFTRLYDAAEVALLKAERDGLLKQLSRIATMTGKPGCSTCIGGPVTLMEQTKYVIESVECLLRSHHLAQEHLEAMTPDRLAAFAASSEHHEEHHQMEEELRQQLATVTADFRAYQERVENREDDEIAELKQRLATVEVERDELLAEAQLWRETCGVEPPASPGESSEIGDEAWRQIEDRVAARMAEHAKEILTQTPPQPDRDELQKILDAVPRVQSKSGRDELRKIAERLLRCVPPDAVHDGIYASLDEMASDAIPLARDWLRFDREAGNALRRADESATEANELRRSVNIAAARTAETYEPVIERLKSEIATLKAVLRDLDGLIESWDDADEERMKEMDKARDEAEKWKSEGDMYGWNFHQGRAGGTISASIIYHRARRVVESWLDRRREALEGKEPNQ